MSRPVARDEPPHQPHDLRLLLPAAGAWVGAVSGGLAPWPLVRAVLIGGSLAAGVAGCRVAGRRRPALFAALVLLVAGAGAAAAGRHVRTSGPVAHLAGQEVTARATLELSGDPVVLPSQPHLPSSVIVGARLLRVTSPAGSWRTRQPVLVIGPASSWRRLLPTTHVTVSAKLRPADGDDVAALLVARGPPQVVGAPSTVQQWAARVRQGLRTAAAGLPASARGLLPGLVLGDTSEMPAADVEDFRASGLSHLTAVSGANVAIVVALVFGLLRLTPLGVRGRAAVSALAVVGFVVLVRPSPSVLRAGAMGLLALLAIGLGRPRALLPALLAVVIGLSLLAPTVVVQAGFALSVLATAGILVLAPGWTVALRARLPPRAGPLAPALAVGLAAQAACVPVVVGIGGGLNLASLPANLLALPAVALTTVLGVTAALLSLWLPGLAAVLCQLAGWPCRWLVALARAGSDVPLASLQVPTGITGALIAAAAVGAVAVAVRRPAGRRALLLAGAVAVLARLAGVR